jgi:phosphoglycerate dehydrogenase-like enzyme
MAAILLSPRSVAKYGEPIRRICAPAGGLRLEAFDGVGSATREQLADVELAFLSMDYMGTSSNPAANPELAGYLDALANAPRLRWLQICSAGVDRPEFQQLMARGVQITTSTGANARAVAQTALAAALAFAREVPLWVQATAAHRWVPRRENDVPRDFDGARAVVVGLGQIGREIAQLCRAFGLHVTGVRRQLAPIAECDEVVTMAQLATVLPRTDWMFLACPLTDQTRGLVDASMLGRLPAHARLINVARGSVVVEADLARALCAGTIAGAYSDVFSVEPLPADSPLWDAPNFLLSAHSAGLSQGFEARTGAIFLDNLERWVQREPLRNPALAASEENRRGPTRE